MSKFIGTVMDKIRYRTYHTLHSFPDALHQILIDVYGQVAKHLTVFCQIKVLQTMLVLFRSVMHLKSLENEYESSFYSLRQVDMSLQLRRKAA